MFNTLVPSEDKRIQEYILLVVNFSILQLIGSLQIAHTMVKLHSASGGRKNFLKDPFNENSLRVPA